LEYIFKNAKNVGDLLDFNMEIPLQRKRKVASTIDEIHYTQHVDIQGYDNLKINMYFPVIDRIMQELDSRFPESLSV